MTNLSVEQLRDLLNYDPETGKLYWRPRPSEMFATEKACKVWHSRFSGKEAFSTVSNYKGHLRGMVLWTTMAAHRAAWALHYGEWPSDQIDHINGDPQDNRITNLRDVSTTENCRNQSTPKHNTSGVCGVSYRNDNQSWRAYINDERGRRFLGSFPTKAEAIAARKAAEKLIGYHPNHGR